MGVKGLVRSLGGHGGKKCCRQQGEKQILWVLQSDFKWEIEVF